MTQKKIFFKIKTFLFLASNLFYSYSWAGDFQGGGGGTPNMSVQKFLDTRSYAIDARTKFVVPPLQVLNTCKFNNTLHSIKKVETCPQYENEVPDSEKFKISLHSYEGCSKLQKAHISREIPNEGLPVCDQVSTKIIDGRVQNVCMRFKENKYRQVKLKFKLDVYQKSTAARFNGYANTNKDAYLRKIKYVIPPCDEVEVEPED